MNEEERAILIEKLATIAHESWSGWMKYLFGLTYRQHDGERIPVALVKRWKRQMETPYERLPEDERPSDRVEAKRFLEAILEDYELVRREKL